MEAAGEFVSADGDMDYFAVAMEKNGMFSGFSGLATDLHYHADGTFVP